MIFGQSSRVSKSSKHKFVTNNLISDVSGVLKGALFLTARVRVAAWLVLVVAVDAWDMDLDMLLPAPHARVGELGGTSNR